MVVMVAQVIVVFVLTGLGLFLLFAAGKLIYNVHFEGNIFGRGFREVSWREAFREAWRLLRGVVDAHGIDAVTAYIGNPTVHSFSLSRYVPAFIALSGLPRVYSAGTADQWPKNLVGALLYGGMWTVAVPDVDRTSHLLMLGANPHASQGSLLAAPDLMGRLAAIRAISGLRSNAVTSASEG